MEIHKKWAMPNKNTFTIKPIHELILKYNNENLISIDPFANNNKLAKITNDIDAKYDCDFNMDALEFLKQFESNSIDLVLFDPPYSPRQLAECYKKLKKSVTFKTTQSSFWSNLKKEISRVTRKNAIVISCGWNSGGIGKKYGFKIQEILLVSHGGQHNDTIVVVDRKE